jgi:hypothetical protein
MTLAKTLAEVKIPVYGIVDLPEDLTFRGHFINTGILHSRVTLLFRSTHYPPYPFDDRMSTLQIGTSTNDMSQSSIPDRMLKEQTQPLRNPFVWEGTITLEGKPFCGTIRYYASPVKLTGFHFKSEELFLSGLSYGPSCDEVIELLEGLQVLNGRDDVLKQYEGKADAP